MQVLKNNNTKNTENVKFCAKFYAKNWLLSTIPLKQNSKAPAIPWQQYQSRIMDEQEIEIYTWHGIGIVTGAVSKLVVIDADTQETIDFLEQFEPFRNTAKVRTKRGIHYYFTVLDLPSEFGCQKIYQENIRIDIKSNGGYVVAPPTVMEIQNGDGMQTVEYQWMEGGTGETGYARPFQEMSFAELQKIIADIKQKLGLGIEEEKEKPVLPELELAGRVDLEKLKKLLIKHWHEGKRQDICMALAGFLAKKGIDIDTAISLVSEIAFATKDKELSMRIAAVRKTYEKYQANEDVLGISGLIEKGIPEEEILECCIVNEEKEIQGKTQLFFRVNKDVYTITGKNPALKWIGPYFDVTAKVFHKGNLLYLLKPVDRDEVLIDPRDIKSLAGALGVLPRVVNSKEIAEFFDVQAEKAKAKKFMDSLGWYKDIFIHPEKLNNDIYLHLEEDFKTAFTPRNIEKQHMVVKEILQKDSILTIKVICAVSSLFFRKGGFVVVEVGERGTGKTLSTELVMSLFYDTEHISTSSYTTVVGMEILLKRLRNFPIMTDELALSRDEKVEFMIFLLSSGRGKTRGNKDLKVSFEKLANVVFTTSERDLIETRFGVKRRVLYLYPKLLGGYKLTPEQMVEFKVGSGCAIDYIKYLTEKGINNFNKNIINYPTLPWTKQISQAVDLLQQFYQVDLSESISMLSDILSQQEKENKVETDIECFYDFIEFLEVNRKRDSSSGSSNDVWFKKVGNNVFVPKNIFSERFIKEFCKGKYSEKIVLNAWREKGILCCKNYPNLTEPVRFPSGLVRCYHIINQINTETEETEIEEIEEIEPF